MDILLQWFLKNPAAVVVVIIALGILAAIVILAFIQGREITLGGEKGLKIGVRPDKSGKTGDNSFVQTQNKEIYKNSDSPGFSELFEERLKKADHLVMIGTGFNILQREDLRGLLAERLREKCHIEIYAANPFSPNVETRLIEEETGDIKPKIRKAGLIGWLKELLSLKDQLPDKSNFTLRLFSFYPTYALFSFDGKDYFYYSYGYAQLGTLSPVMHYSVENPSHTTTIKFLDDQYRLIKERSVDAELVFNLHPFNKKKVNKNELAAFAVYLIPPADSDLYEFGLKVIGYDVRTGEFQPNVLFPNAVGAASEYGLHVTLADALYCATKSDIHLICKEVEFLAKEFHSFTLKLSLEKDFPNERGIALVCQDKTGSLEALHHEMVARVYHRAVASNYNFDPGLADRDQDQERAALMIEHYHAPYILQRFRPHFSLRSNVSPEKKERIYAEVRKYYEKEVKDSSIKISQIAIMHRPDPKRPWQILHEYPVGGVS